MVINHGPPSPGMILRALKVTEVYFLAGYYGLMEVLVDEIKRLTDGCHLGCFSWRDKSGRFTDGKFPFFLGGFRVFFFLNLFPNFFFWKTTWNKGWFVFGHFCRCKPFQVWDPQLKDAIPCPPPRVWKKAPLWSEVKCKSFKCCISHQKSWFACQGFSSCWDDPPSLFF